MEYEIFSGAQSCCVYSFRWYLAIICWVARTDIGALSHCCSAITLTPAWISNHIHYNVWSIITYPFLNFIGAALEVLEWISNFTPHFSEHVITYPCKDDLNHVIKGGTGDLSWRIWLLEMSNLQLLKHNKAWTVCIPWDIFRFITVALFTYID